MKINKNFKLLYGKCQKYPNKYLLKTYKKKVGQKVLSKKKPFDLEKVCAVTSLKRKTNSFLFFCKSKKSVFNILLKPPIPLSNFVIDKTKFFKKKQNSNIYLFKKHCEKIKVSTSLNFKKNYANLSAFDYIKLKEFESLSDNNKKITWKFVFNELFEILIRPNGGVVIFERIFVPLFFVFFVLFSLIALLFDL